MSRFDVGWQVDDTDLQTAASNVEDLSSKWGIPALEGEDVPVAYRRGRVWRRKYAGPRDVPLGMWVNGNDPATGLPAADLERQFQRNMTALQRLLWTDGQRQVVLRKRWRDPDTDAIVSATALAELAGGLDVAMSDRHTAKCVATFHLADPYFYGAEETATFTVAGGPQVLEVAGDVPTYKIGLMVNGALSNAVLTNSTPDPDLWVKIGSSVAAGDQVFLGVEEFTATRASDDANLIGTVTRSGGRHWMQLWPGSNTLTLTATSGAGNIAMTYAPAYL